MTSPFGVSICSCVCKLNHFYVSSMIFVIFFLQILSYNSRHTDGQEKTSMPPPPTPSHGQRPPPLNLQAAQAASGASTGPQTPGTPTRPPATPPAVPGTPTSTASSETSQTPTRTSAVPSTPSTPGSSTHPLLVAKLRLEQPAEEKPKMYVPSGSGHYGTCTVSDCRSLVKTVVCGVKTITWGISSCKGTGGELFSVGVLLLTVIA